jgi:hypothetical protein
MITNGQAHQSPGQGGPPLGVLAAVSTALFVGGLFIAAGVAHGFPPGPGASASSIAAYAVQHATSNRISAVFTFGSAVPLAIYAATANARLHALGVRAPGATIALAGGLLASGFLALSGLCSWVLCQPGIAADNTVTRAISDLEFATGGPAHVVLLGLLVAGIAVPATILGLLPRPLAVAGLVLAAVCELSSLTLATSVLFPLLPVGRFASLVWLIAAGFALPRRRGLIPSRATRSAAAV